MDTDSAGLALPLLVAGRKVLVAGGGPAAIGRCTALVRSGAAVTIVASEVDAALEDLVDRGHVNWRAEELDAEALRGVALVVPATGSSDADTAVADLAAVVGVLCTAPAPRQVGQSPGGRGNVVLVGGGPGDPGLITVRGLQEVRRADVVVVDRLAPLSVLDDLPGHVEVIDVSKIPHGRSTPQEDINAVLIERARAGRRVVRLKGGDPYVFGRGMEEVIACAEAGIPVDVVPGVTSAVAAPELAGIPVTHRGVSQGFTVISGHVPPGDPRSNLDWAALARTGTTLVLLMAVRSLPRICATLLDAGMAPTTPLAMVMDAGLPSQRTHRGDVSGIARDGIPDGVAPPAVTVIGAVAGDGLPGEVVAAARQR